MSIDNSEKFRCTYLLPIRRVRVNQEEVEDFVQYFRELAQAGCEVLVVDGSPAEIFAANNRAWRDVCRHVTVDPKYTYLNGKSGVHTGFPLAIENIHPRRR